MDSPGTSGACPRIPSGTGERHMRQMLRLVAFSFLFAGSALLFWPRNHVECAGGVESQPCKLVAEALETASKMKVGILRADVERDFELDGGMSVRDRGTIRSWGGPGKGTVEMDGARWIPYQAATFPTPPFPDYVSGHSTYSAAAARILALWAGNDWRFCHASGRQLEDRTWDRTRSSSRA